MRAASVWPCSGPSSVRITLSGGSASVVGLVLVGHSAALVDGLAAMVRQAAPGVPVETAGGLSGGRLGTSGPDVAGALRRALDAAAGDDVVVLLDLGSAALALDIALDDLDGAERERVR